MTKIKRYPLREPTVKDFFVGTDSEDNNKTVNFGFEESTKLISELIGTSVVKYRFMLTQDAGLNILNEGDFISNNNNTAVDAISKLQINKKNLNEDNVSELFRFLSINKKSFLLKLRNSDNLNNVIYFNILEIKEYSEYFSLNISIEISNNAFNDLVPFDVYFFNFELSNIDLVVSLPEFNKITTQTGFSSSLNGIAFNASWVWLLKNVSYSHPLSVLIAINPAAPGKKRIDVFVLNNLNTFQTIIGDEVLKNPIKPIIPSDTIEVTFCTVGVSGIESVEPLDLSEYATKNQLSLKANKTFVNIKDFGAIGDGINDDKKAIEDAVASLPIQGGVVYIPNGTYYSPSGYLINRDNVTLIGETMPRVNNSLDALTGGSILQGGIVIDGNNINVENIGADFGITYSNAKRSGNGGDGFVIHKTGLNGIIKNISVKNIIGLVRIGNFNDAQAAFHAVLLEGIQFGSAINVTGIGGWFGIVIKATDFSAFGLTGRENDAASVYIKSNSYAPVARVSISNINISNYIARGFVGLLIQSSNAELQNVTATNINVNGGAIAVRVEAEVTEPCVAVSISNITARGVSSGISVRGAVYGFLSSNVIIYSPLNSGFETSQNTANIHPLDVLVDNLRIMPSATTTIALNIGNANTNGVFSNINVSGSDGKTLSQGSIINLQTGSIISNYIGVLKRAGILTDAYRFKGGGVTTDISNILTTINKRTDFANPLISLVEGYLQNDSPFIQAYNNFNLTNNPLEINPFGGPVSFGGAVRVKSSLAAKTIIENIVSDLTFNGTVNIIAANSGEVYFVNTGTNACTLVLPIAFPTGESITIIRNRAAGITFSGEEGVTIVSSFTNVSANGTAKALKVNTTTWVLSGNLQ
jgi:hypothetical protein